MRVLTYTAILLFSFTFSAIAGDSFHPNKHASVNAFLSQRTTAVSKASCPTAAQARIKAEKANPGWRVVSIKELSKVWHITLKKS